MTTMNDPTKHTIDLLAFFTGVAAWFKVFTDILGFFLVVAGLIWYGIRFYEWIVHKKIKE